MLSKLLGIALYPVRLNDARGMVLSSEDRRRLSIMLQKAAGRS